MKELENKFLEENRDKYKEQTRNLKKWAKTHFFMEKEGNRIKNAIYIIRRRRRWKIITMK